MHTCVWEDVYTLADIRTYVCMQAILIYEHIYMRIRMCTYACIHTSTYTYVCMHVILIYEHLNILIRMHTYIYECIDTNTYAYTRSPYRMHTYVVHTVCIHTKSIQYAYMRSPYRSTRWHRYNTNIHSHKYIRIRMHAYIRISMHACNTHTNAYTRYTCTIHVLRMYTCNPYTHSCAYVLVY